MPDQHLATPFLAGNSDPCLYRIQDAQGRGPWRPGFSTQWVDETRDFSLCPPMMHEFPNWRRAVDRGAARGLVHFGCCVRGVAGLHRWFAPSEIAKLRGFGYRLVDASALTVLVESPAQIIGASRWPLSYLPVLEWERVK